MQTPTPLQCPLTGEELTGPRGSAVRYIEGYRAAERLDAAIQAGGTRAVEAARLLAPWVAIRDACRAAAMGVPGAKGAAPPWHRHWLQRVDDLLERRVKRNPKVLHRTVSPRFY